VVLQKLRKEAVASKVLVTPILTNLFDIRASFKTPEGLYFLRKK